MSQLWSENFDSSPNTVDSDAAYSNSSTSSISYFSNFLSSLVSIKLERLLRNLNLFILKINLSK